MEINASFRWQGGCVRQWFLLFAFVCGPVLAQNESASLTGTITDSSGAAAVRAAVRLENSNTGESYQLASSDSGSYDFQLLEPGRCSLTVELPGFKQFIQSGIVLETGVPAM